MQELNKSSDPLLDRETGFDTKEEKRLKRSLDKTRRTSRQKKGSSSTNIDNDVEEAEEKLILLADQKQPLAKIKLAYKEFITLVTKQLGGQIKQQEKIQSGLEQPDNKDFEAKKKKLVEEYRIKVVRMADEIDDILDGQTNEPNIQGD